MGKKLLVLLRYRRDPRGRRLRRAALHDERAGPVAIRARCRRSPPRSARSPRPLKRSYRGDRGTRAQHRALRRAGESRALPRGDARGVRLHGRPAGIRASAARRCATSTPSIEPQAGIADPEVIVRRRALRQRARTRRAPTTTRTGTAAVLELARLLDATCKGQTRKRIRLVLFVNEEPPYFMTEDMGSLRYARGACGAQASASSRCSRSKRSASTPTRRAARNIHRRSA